MQIVHNPKRERGTEMELCDQAACTEFRLAFRSGSS